MSDAVKTRFAPSPTGRIHLGNVRTALFNVLLARKHRSTFLLRIEDTDQERSKPEFQEALQRDLHWLGLDWQEGPEMGGPHEPYNQSQRGEIYAQYYQQLIDQGLAYDCYCSETELKLVRKSQLASGQPPRYAGTCARLNEEEQAKKAATGVQPSLRFRVPKDTLIEFEDAVRGPQKFKSDDIGDFIIRRSDGTPAFFFTNAIDDALMGVTHVMRGEDHITNTPRQLMLLEALGLPIPAYGHISLIVGEDGAPLSKRNGSMSVDELKERGFLPIAVNNHLARLGHKYEEDGFMDDVALGAGFDISRCGKAPARHDESQLMHWQKEAVSHLSDDELVSWLSDYDVADQLPQDVSLTEFVSLVRENVIMPEDAAVWAKQYFVADVFSEQAIDALKEAGAEFIACAERLLADADEFKPYAQAVSAELGVKGKQLFMPLRAIFSGDTHGPEMAKVFSVVNKSYLSNKIAAAKKVVS